MNIQSMPEDSGSVMIAVQELMNKTQNLLGEAEAAKQEGNYPVVAEKATAAMSELGQAMQILVQNCPELAALIALHKHGVREITFTETFRRDDQSRKAQQHGLLRSSDTYTGYETTVRTRNVKLGY